MILWRVEDDDGVGPFTRDDVAEIDGDIHGDIWFHNDPFHFPNWSNDALIEDRWRDLQDRWGEAYSAFKSIPELDSWFSSEERRCLSDRGYHLVKYEASNGGYHLGDRQALFDKAQATAVATYSLDPGVVDIFHDLEPTHK